MNEMIDFNNPEFLENPYPYYAKLRQLDRPLWVPQPEEMASASRGMWFFSRYEDAVAVFKHSESISNNMLKVLPKSDTNPFFTHLLNRDGGDHARLHGLVKQYFSQKYVKSIESHITSVVERLIKSLYEKEDIDLISDFAEKIPFGVIADIIGIPVEDMVQIREWTIDISDGFDTVLIDKNRFEKRETALKNFIDYLTLLTQKEDQIDNTTLLYSLIEAKKEGSLSHDELLGMVGFLLVSGHETTISLIGNGLWLLLSHHDQWDLLCNEPTLVPSAIEEILRYESPLQRSSFRMVEKPVEINGVVLNPGEQISILIAAANRDEKVFSNPDQFDIQRDPNPHLAFGLGVHNCIGRHLARVEARIAFEKMTESFPEMKLEIRRPTWKQNTLSRGLIELPVTLS
jgi:cytochrome P450